MDIDTLILEIYGDFPRYDFPEDNTESGEDPDAEER